MDKHPRARDGKFTNADANRDDPGQIVDRRKAGIKKLRSGHSGVTTWAVDTSTIKSVAQWRESQGLDPYGMRGYRRNSAGEHTFKTGIGYNVVDEDLLGGDGTGSAQEQFTKDTGIYF